MVFEPFFVDSSPSCWLTTVPPTHSVFLFTTTRVVDNYCSSFCALTTLDAPGILRHAGQFLSSHSAALSLPAGGNVAFTCCRRLSAIRSITLPPSPRPESAATTAAPPCHLVLHQTAHVAPWPLTACTALHSRKAHFVTSTKIVLQCRWRCTKNQHSAKIPMWPCHRQRSVHQPVQQIEKYPECHLRPLS